MQAYQLVELGALIAANGSNFVREPARLPDARIGRYWSASRMRFDRWAKTLRKAAQGAGTMQDRPSSAWQAIEATLEEIFMSELLTRVWAAVACEHDRRQGYTSTSPVVRSIVLGHMESRNRALHAMFREQENDAKSVHVMNRLRHRSERWTDMLLAHLVPDCEVAQFAFDAKRCQDFADDLREEFQGDQFDQAWRLMTVSLRATFVATAREHSPNADLNGQIGSSVAACFHPDVFDSSDLFRTFWIERLNHLTDDAQAMIEELLEA
jgi:hypothetical protein